MTVKDAVDLLFAARGRIDFFWNFYVVVVIAVIGWLMSLKKGLTLSMKILVSVAYVVAAAMTLTGLYSSYTFAEALRIDLLRMTAATPLIDTRHLLEQHSYLTQRLIGLWVHIAVGTAILIVLWFGHFPDAGAGPTRCATDDKT